VIFIPFPDYGSIRDGLTFIYHLLSFIFNLMTWLLKLSRIAFICNLFFLLAFSLQLTKWIHDEQLTSTILIIGYVMGFILNPLANFSYLVFGIFSRKSLIIVPSWLIVANVLFLVIDAFYILYINSHS
jgi:hypothetical protein